MATLILAILLIVHSAVVLAEEKSRHDPHAGHAMSDSGKDDPHAGHKMPATSKQDPHAGHSMSKGSKDPHAGHRMPGGAIPDVITSAEVAGRPVATAPPEAALSGPPHAADLYFDREQMFASRNRLRVENGGMQTNAVVFDRLEAATGEGEDGYAWDVQGWYGGDIHRFWWKSEAEAEFGEAMDEVELQLLYGRAMTPYADLQAGVRQVYTPGPDRTDLVVSVQGLAPYWIEFDAAAFLSTKGELRARAEAEYDLRLTQRTILQLRGEVNLSAESVPELEIGSGLTSLEFGVRVRHEFSRQFAPYIGLEWSGSQGNTRRMLNRAGEHTDETRFVLGIRSWL